MRTELWGLVLTDHVSTTIRLTTIQNILHSFMLSTLRVSVFFVLFLFFRTFQIFYDLVRQINRKTPVEKKKAKKKSNCILLQSQQQLRARSVIISQLYHTTLIYSLFIQSFFQLHYFSETDILLRPNNLPVFGN